MVIAAAVLIGWILVSVVVAFAVAALMRVGSDLRVGDDVAPAEHTPIVASPSAETDREYPLAS